MLLLCFQKGNFPEIGGKQAPPCRVLLLHPVRSPRGEAQAAFRAQGSTRCKSRTEKYLRSSALNTSDPRQRPWGAQSRGNPLPKELRIKKECPCKKGGRVHSMSCSTRGHRGGTGPRTGGGTGRRPQCREPSLAVDALKSRFPQPLPHAGSSRGRSPNQLWLFSAKRQPRRGARLQPRSPPHPQG